MAFAAAATLLTLRSVQESSKAGIITAPPWFFGSQLKQTIESAGNKPSSSSKTRPHSAWMYFPHPGQFFQSS
jgi:hypothetical protein